MKAKSFYYFELRIYFMKKKIVIPALIVLSLLLVVSIGFNIYFCIYDTSPSGMWNRYSVYAMEAGILKNNLEFKDGKDIDIEYDFENSEYSQLIDTYKIDKTAGSGSELERALNLMNEYAPRLTHLSNYDNHIAPNAIALLEYSLDNKNQGINCKAKAQILNEMCLALGIYSRKVWLMPNSEYDGDCHVVNEIYDSNLNKWIMLDITNNQYWVDENGTPLSILEIRTKGAMQEFCTPVQPGDSLENLEQLKNKYIGNFLYIMKNMNSIEYFDRYSVGEDAAVYTLCPKNFESDNDKFISKEACERSPIK